MNKTINMFCISAIGLIVALLSRADTIDLASVEGDTLEVTTLANGTDYTNSSGSTKTLALNLSGDATYSGTISGKIKLEVSNSDTTKTLTLGGENTFTDGVEVKSGTLNVGRPEALGTGTVTLANAKSYLKFSASMTVPNAIVLNQYSSAGYQPTLIVGANCQVVLSGLVTSNSSWVRTLSSNSTAAPASLSFAGGIDVASTELYCQPNAGTIFFVQTPFDIASPKVLKVVGVEAFYLDRHVAIDVAGNNVSKISFANRGCLKLGVEQSFSNKPDLYMPHDSRRAGLNGGGVDLNGHSQDFGTVSFQHGAAQNSFLVCNSAGTPATFSFEQSANETSACVETSGALDFVKKGTASFTITNTTFSVSGRVDVAAGALKFTGVDGVRLAESISVRKGATLDLGGNVVSCGTFLNMGGTVTNGTLSAETNIVMVSAGDTLSLSDGDLAVYYPLDRTDRLCVDQSFHGNADLLVRGSVECVADAKFGKALSLDGSSALTNSVFPATLPTGATAWSTCIHLKLRSYASGKYHPIGWGKCSFSQANFLQLTSAAKFDHIIWSDTALTGSLASGNFADGWHSLVLTYSPAGNVRSMYFDGTRVASGEVKKDSASHTPNVAAQDFSLGGQHNNEKDWNGWLDEAAVFRRTLTADEVAEYHANGVAGLVAEPFDGISYDAFAVEDGATLRIAQRVTIPKLAGPGTVETWGLTVTEAVSGCPSVIGDVTLAADTEVQVDALSATEDVPLLRVTGGELTDNGAKLVVNGVCDPAKYRLFARDGVLYGRRRKGFVIIFK